MSDASSTIVKKKSVGQRIRDFLCDHKTTIVLSGCVVTLLAALVYVAKKYTEIKTENTELLNAAEKYAELKTEHTGLLQAVKKCTELMTQQTEVLKMYAVLNPLYLATGLPAHYYKLGEQINELKNVARKK